MRLSPPIVLATALALAFAAAADAGEAPERSSEPVILTGVALGPLVGIAPERLVAFRHSERGARKRGTWTQVPVQVDERKFVDFGANPPAAPPPGEQGTVYGTRPIGHGAIQYADPSTFVGPDADPSLDRDDEVALVSGDAGDRARFRRAHKHARRPRGVRGAGVRITLTDPLGGPRRFLYLFESEGARTSDAGRDYVDYDFSLTSGDYRSTYERGDGPNPEKSRISTGVYTAGFSDRWYFDQLALGAGDDVLDGFKFSFGPTSCGRSEKTFNEAEGAFVANLDGPVRAIRAYVGANSGPFTQRTHVFYGDRHEIVTDLRVHPVPGPMTYHELSRAGIGMSYSNSAGAPPVTVDGAPDEVSETAAEWHLWSGAQGSLFAADRLESSFADALLAAAGTWYLDDADPAFPQCWGDPDGQALGQAGLRSTTPMPNTDPTTGGDDFLHTTTTEILAAGAVGVEQARSWSAELDAPLSATTTPVRRR